MITSLIYEIFIPSRTQEMALILFNCDTDSASLFRRTPLQIVIFRLRTSARTTSTGLMPSDIDRQPVVAAVQSAARMHQYLFLVGSGLGLLVILLSSLPRSLNHFFVPNSNSRSSSALGSFRCIKLQKPPLTHPSPLFNLQHASRKSVTGESSQ